MTIRSRLVWAVLAGSGVTSTVVRRPRRNKPSYSTGAALGATAPVVSMFLSHTELGEARADQIVGDPTFGL